MNRYRPLLLAVLIAAVGLTVMARMPRHQKVTTSAPAAVPVCDLSIEVRDGAVIPAAASVPKDHLVRLEVRNTGTRATDLKLAGYESRVSLDSLAQGERWTTEFVADLPGDDFAWLVHGQPVGRLGVTGSHLIEGHR